MAMPKTHRAAIGATLAALLLTIGLSACGGDAKSADKGTASAPVPETATVDAEDAVFDPATATDDEKWDEYMRLVATERLGKEFWVANNAEQAVKPSYQVVCSRTAKQEIGGIGLMAIAYDMDELEQMNRGEVLFDQVYCPEQAPTAEEAWTQYQAQAKAKPKPVDISIKIKIRSQECFGSAGCNVSFQIDPGYDGPSDLSGSYDITYKVTGGDDPKINTFTLKNGNARFDQEEFISTPSSSSKLTAQVIRVDTR